MIRNNQRRRRGGGGNGPRPQQMAGGNNYGARLDNRQRGNATQLLEKYRALARDAQQAGDRVTAEYYLQYAEHYFRLLGDYRDRQPEGRRGRDGFEDDGIDSDVETAEGEDERGDDGEDRRDERRDERREERGERNRDRRDDRNREERSRDDRNRDERGRDERGRDDRNRDERGGDRNRRDWQRDRRERRPERGDAPRDTDTAQPETAAHDADDRESLLQALPPPVARPEGRSEGRRLSLRRDEAPAVADESDAPAVEEAAPRRRTRTRKPVAEAESAE